jgi:hypothetical protein
VREIALAYFSSLTQPRFDRTDVVSVVDKSVREVA